jgi:hypothetical protein
MKKCRYGTNKQTNSAGCSVSDPYLFDKYPDPIGIQDFDNQKLKKNLILYFFGLKNYSLPIPRPP